MHEWYGELMGLASAGGRSSDYLMVKNMWQVLDLNQENKVLDGKVVVGDMGFFRLFGIKTFSPVIFSQLLVISSIMPLLVLIP